MISFDVLFTTLCFPFQVLPQHTTLGIRCTMMTRTGFTRPLDHPWKRADQDPQRREANEKNNNNKFYVQHPWTISSSTTSRRSSSSGSNTY